MVNVTLSGFFSAQDVLNFLSLKTKCKKNASVNVETLICSKIIIENRPNFRSLRLIVFEVQFATPYLDIPVNGYSQERRTVATGLSL